MASVSFPAHANYSLFLAVMIGICSKERSIISVSGSMRHAMQLLIVQTNRIIVRLSPIYCGFTSHAPAPANCVVFSLRTVTSLNASTCIKPSAYVK